MVERTAGRIEGVKRAEGVSQQECDHLRWEPRRGGHVAPGQGCHQQPLYARILRRVEHGGAGDALRAEPAQAVSLAGQLAKGPAGSDLRNSVGAPAA
jgi:hypothetical protein